MQYLKLAWYWLVFSSSNAQKISLTIKAGLIAALTYATVIAGLANISLPNDLLTQIIDTTVMLVQSFLLAVSYAAALIGLVRKVMKTFSGTNEVLQ